MNAEEASQIIDDYVHLKTRQTPCETPGIYLNRSFRGFLFRFCLSSAVQRADDLPEFQRAQMRWRRRIDQATGSGISRMIKKDTDGCSVRVAIKADLSPLSSYYPKWKCNSYSATPQSRMLPSSLPVTSSLPSGLNARQVS